MVALVELQRSISVDVELPRIEVGSNTYNALDGLELRQVRTDEEVNDHEVSVKE